MTRSLGRRAGAVVILTALLAVVSASPAGAEPVIEVEQPRDGHIYETASVSFRGRVNNGSPLHAVKTVTLAAAGKTHRIDCTETPCPFSWRLDVAANGPYQLKVTATEATVLLGTPGTPADQTQAFKVAAPPATPVLDPPRVNDGRNVDLSWSRNTEPDMLHYAVFRRDPGASEYRRVGGDVAHPASGTKVRYTDATTGALDGGDYAYVVVAVRKGASGTASTKVTSDPSRAGTAAVPPPATSSTTAPPPGAPSTGAPATTTTAKPGATAGVDLSGFLSSRSQPAPLTPITVPAPPDTGFRGTLPFGAIPPGDELEEGEQEAVPPPRRPSSSVVSSIDNGRPLVPVAGGLILVLLALHMRLLNRRVKSAAGGDLPLDVAASTSAPPEPPRAVLYDVLEDEDWAEVEEEPEPEPEPVALWAPPQVDDDLDDIHDLEENEPEPEAEPVALWAAPEVDDDIDDLDDADELEESGPEPEPEPVALWAPSEADDDLDDADDLDELDELEDLDELVDLEDFGEITPEPEPDEEIEVFEVVSPTRRRLARVGSR